MRVERVGPLHADEARGVVIVIDVIRAFTVAAFAFAGGARAIWLVRTIQEAHALREHEPDALLAGEVQGRLIPGFDHNNSPSRIAAADVRERLLIQRTGAGTQGAVNATNASQILICSLTNARATATYANAQASATQGVITLLPSGSFPGSDPRNEDEVCANYLEALLLGRDDAEQALADDIAYLHADGRFQWFAPGDTDAPIEDVDAILAIDRFNFAMSGAHKHWRDITYVDVRRIDLE